MAQFSDNIRNRFAKRPTKTAAKNVKADAYFIRLKKSLWRQFIAMLKSEEHPDVFIHYEGAINSDEVEYRAKKGIEGACLFKLENALAFIKESGVKNLELVRVNKVINK
jgi:hypothetical protein